MSSHWPVMLAVLIVSAAVAFGLYTQNESEEKGRIIPVIKSVPTKYVPNVEVRPVGAAQTAPAGRTAAANEATAFKTLPPPPAIVQKKATNGAIVPAGKAVGVPAQPLTGGTERDTIFNNLRIALIQKYGMQPSATNTGFTLFVEGARIDADTTSNWSVNIYNDNKANPTIQSENFLIIQNMVAANFEFDLNAPPHNSADGKITKRPPSKLGRLTLTIDPALNNSVSIKPLMSRPQMPIPNANTPKPALVTPPITKPMPPATPVAPPTVVQQPAQPQALNPTRRPTVVTPNKQPPPMEKQPTPAPNTAPKNPVVDQF